MNDIQERLALVSEEAVDLSRYDSACGQQSGGRYFKTRNQCETIIDPSKVVVIGFFTDEVDAW